MSRFVELSLPRGDRDDVNPPGEGLVDPSDMREVADLSEPGEPVVSPRGGRMAFLAERARLTARLRDRGQVPQ